MDVGSELFGMAKDASFNGIRNMWNMEVPENDEEEYQTEEDAQRAEVRKEIHKMKVQALRCKDLAQKATDEETRQRFMERYEGLMQAANEMSSELYTFDLDE